MKQFIYFKPTIRSIGRSPWALAVSLATLGLGLSATAEAPRRTFITSDRKSTRLNSSHGSISYAVFCLKNKIRLADLLEILVALAPSLWSKPTERGAPKAPTPMRRATDVADTQQTTNAGAHAQL